MLDLLHKAERELPLLLRNEGGWNGVRIDYHPPYVERLWLGWGEYRLYLHRIHPCSPEEALFHTHPWPSAMKVLDGTYEMAVGYGQGTADPPVAARLLLGPGSEYEMTNPDGWHSVRPIGGPSISFMITGRPWARISPKSTSPLLALEASKREDLLHFFLSIYR